MILVDSSVWIDFFSNHPTPQVKILDSIFDTKNESLCICGAILTEVLQGIRNEGEYRLTRSMFEELIFLPMPRNTFLMAADIYRFLRQRGITIRKPLDCMIAAVALENDIGLLHNDRDFESIEKHFGLKCISS